MRASTRPPLPPLLRAVRSPQSVAMTSYRRPMMLRHRLGQRLAKREAAWHCYGEFAMGG